MSMKLKVGTMVHYKLPNAVCMAAVVTYIVPDVDLDDTVALQVFYPPFSIHIPEANLTRVPAGNEQMYQSIATWHYIENCSA